MNSPNISSLDHLRSNLEEQLSELDMLESTFCKPGEIKIDDVSVLNHIRQFVAGNTDDLPPYLDLTLNLVIEGAKFEMCVSLPNEYPTSEPDIFVRNNKLNREQHTNLNKDLVLHVSNFKGDPCIFTAASWLQDNADNYVVAEVEHAEKINKRDGEKLVRYWIYSHHIYSKSKRREILNLAQTLKLTGFCMPGKPGIICVEGDADDCAEWWQAIKSMNWKKIFCKITEDCKEEMESFLKFKTFEETIFTNNSIKCNHMDLGELCRFLEEHQCAYVFKDLFGIDNKSAA